jgi:tRNA G18 (ribose-2'-O)-methylase SpoU
MVLGRSSRQATIASVVLIPVSDAADPRLSGYRTLRDADLRRDVEGVEGVFVVEGVTAIRRLVASPYEVHSVLVTAAKAAALEDVLVDVAGPVFVADREVLAGVVGFHLHRGAVALGRRRPELSVDEVASGAERVVVLEGVSDHENLGAIARSATALGVEGLLLDPTGADPLYRRSVRVSMGELLHLPFTRLRPWPGSLASLGRLGFTVIALTPAPSAPPVDVVAAEVGHERVALLLGTEGAGLTPAAVAAAHRTARIPMRTGADSLNVGHAAAIAFHVFGRLSAADPGLPALDQ